MNKNIESRKYPQLISWLILFMLLPIFSLKAENPEWIIYNTENSKLPSNFIWDVEIDSIGNKWIITGKYIVKFDGDTTWTIYSKENSNLPSNYAKTIAIDSKNNKWIGFYVNGLAKFDDKNWTFYNTDNSQLCDDQTSIISIDRNDNIWIGTKFGGASKFDGYSNWITYDSSYCPMKSQYITGIDFDNDGNKWITSYAELVRINTDTSWNLYNSKNTSLPNKAIISLKISKTDLLYIGITKLYSFDRDTTWVEYKDNTFITRQIKDIDFDINNDIWLALDGPMGGLAYSNDLENWTSIDTMNSQLPNENVYALAIDKYGNKWIGTYGGGLAVYRKGGVVGVKDISTNNDSQLLIFPNPASDNITVDLSKVSPRVNPWVEGQEIDIYDVYGNEMNTTTPSLRDTPPEEGNIRVDVSALPTGTYFLRAGSQVYKFMVVR